MQKKSYSAQFKAKVALELVKEQKTLNEVASEYNVHPNMITKWRRQLLDGLPEIFTQNNHKKDKEIEKLVASLYQKIGKLEVERDWLKKKSEILR
jgi:transposase-like protein